MVILVAFLAIAVLALLGNPWLGVPFVVIEVGVLTHHGVTLCRRCSNVACPFNPRATEKEQHVSRDAGGEYSDLPITRTTVVPLLAAYPLAVIAAWQFSPLATVAVGAVGLAAHSVFRKLTCSHCGNNCVGNCNGHYKEWRATREQAAG